MQPLAAIPPSVGLALIVGAPIAILAFAVRIGYELGLRRRRRLDLGYVQISGKITAAHAAPDGATVVDEIAVETVEVSPHLQSLEGGGEG